MENDEIANKCLNDLISPNELGKKNCKEKVQWDHYVRVGGGGPGGLTTNKKIVASLRQAFLLSSAVF